MRLLTRPGVLCIAGNDSAGMAGLSADTKTITALGAHAFTVCTAITAQNSNAFIALNAVGETQFKSQLDAINNGDFSVIKIGLLANLYQLELLDAWLAKRKHRVIFDPIIAASAGDCFWSKAMLEIVKYSLAPKISLFTPNIPECEQLLGRQIHSKQDIQLAATDLLSLGFKAVLIKGGHAHGELAQDWFSDGTRHFWLSSPRVPTDNSRGTGCVFSSACAAALSLQYSLYDAVVIGKMAINQGLRHAYRVGNQRGPLHLSHFPQAQDDLPNLSVHNHESVRPAFPECNSPKLGLYPVVDRAAWLERLLPLGVSTAQLRIKDLTGAELEAEIQAAIALGKQYNCRLFINDYWRLAIKHGAYGVHLGQEDLDDADIEAIYQAGLRLGTSTHCHYEVARAHYYRPSYIAIGPVYATTTKIMPWIPHGPDGFHYWRQTLHYPLVAIGGINAERIQPMLNAGADSIAMITAITHADTPEQQCRLFLEQINDFQHN